MLRRFTLVIAGLTFGCVSGGEGDIDPSIAHADSANVVDDADQEPDAGESDGGIFPAEDTMSTADTDGVDSSASETSVDAAPVDSGCTPSCTTCGASDGCGGKCATGSCGGGATCFGGTCVSPTHSYLSPGSYAFGSAWAKAITWTIGSESPSTIFYTLDGSTPNASSPNKAAPASFSIGTSGTIIKWYADNGAKEPTVHSYTANIDTAGQQNFGWLVDKVSLDGKGPVVVVSPGASITGSANYEGWNDSTCAGCRMQIVYGIDSSPVGCLYDWSPGVWPGASGSGTINVTAPTSPGTYKLTVTYTLQTSCANGVAVAPMAHGSASVATIVVK